jgi:methyl-accepting chemotaxis protein/methyl-accepting chemotaxis protein-1 (serine sensor receptor)
MVAAMKAIRDSSGQIEKIIKVIEEIAFRTNLLALNAAVEAARAGEAGMGFSVVAGEVRSLAQRAAQAVQETAPLLEAAVAHTRGGDRILDRLRSAMAGLQESAASARGLISEVSRDSREQARVVEQISGALRQLESVTQQSAAAAQESAAASQSLDSQAGELEATVGQLQHLIGSN